MEERIDRRQAVSLLLCAGVGARLGKASPVVASYRLTCAYLQSLVDARQCNGAIVRVFRNGTMEMNATVGYMDSAYTVPMRDDAIFSMASMTKPVVGVSVLMLVEQGKIKLREPIDRWLPELAHRRVLRNPAGSLQETYVSPRPITVSDLLSFRMGLGVSGGVSGPITAALNQANPPVIEMERMMTYDQWLKGLGELPLQYAPGDRWLYNTSADLLGALIYRVTGAQMSEFMRTNLFEPLKMTDTSFYANPAKAERLAGWPAGYTRSSIQSPPRMESGGGGMYSTASDYMAFMRMLVNKGTLDAHQFLRPETIDLMTTNRMKIGESPDLPPGWGYGYTVAVRTSAAEPGPSVGSFRWQGASGVWFMIDPGKNMASLLMVQHPNPKSIGFADASQASRFIPLQDLHGKIEDTIYRDAAVVRPADSKTG